MGIVEDLRSGDRRALARAISIVENGGEGASGLRRSVRPLSGNALILGFTGPPGAGKSTLIDAYVSELRRLERTVGIAVVDPSSPISGGAILGDRVRMGRHTQDPGVFIRSVASRGHLGGLSHNIHDIADLMDAAGFDVVILETVGTGQSEIEIVEIADIRVVVGAPGLGDQVQAVKAGILEIADVLVVNKADQPLADQLARQLRDMLKLRRPEHAAVPVIQTVAVDGTGCADLHEAIEALAGTRSRNRAQVRRERLRRLVAQAAAHLVETAFIATRDGKTDNLLNAVADGDLDVETAAARWLGLRPPVD